MLEITVMNCDDKKVQYEWVSEREFIDDIDSNNENIPMLDDVLTAVDTDDDELHNWWKNTDGMTVDDLYEECNRRLKNEYKIE